MYKNPEKYFINLFTISKTYAIIIKNKIKHIAQTTVQQEVIV